MDGKNRFDLSESKHYHLWHSTRTPFNYLSRLYLNADDQTKLGQIVKEEFDRYTYLKSDDNNYIHILLSKLPKTEIAGSTEKTLTDSLEEIAITEFGDGVKCFVGLCLSILACPFRIVLIDEPEAFLHPPTAYSLGRNLSQWAKEKRPL